MLAEVGALLDVDFSVDRFVQVVERPPAESSFVLCHLIDAALGAGRPVCVLALDKPVSHYRYLCAKTGSAAVLSQGSRGQRLSIIDGAEALLKAVPGESPLRVSARDLYLVLQPHMRAGVVLMLDCVAALVDLMSEAGQVALLVHNLLAQMALHDGTLVVLAACGEADEQLCSMAAALEAACDLTVEVRPLATGHCPEVTGELEVRRRHRPTELKQFRAQDKNVRVFAPGTSSAVL